MVRVTSPVEVLVTLPSGRQHRFHPGEQDAPEAAARHWYAVASGVREVQAKPLRRKPNPSP